MHSIARQVQHLLFSVNSANRIILIFFFFQCYMKHRWYWHACIALWVTVRNLSYLKQARLKMKLNYLHHYAVNKSSVQTEKRNLDEIMLLWLILMVERTFGKTELNCRGLFQGHVLRCECSQTDIKLGGSWIQTLKFALIPFKSLTGGFLSCWPARICIQHPNYLSNSTYKYAFIHVIWGIACCLSRVFAYYTGNCLS